MKQIIKRLFTLLIIAMAIGIPSFSQKKVVKKTVSKPPVQKTVVSILATNAMDTVTGTRYAMTIEHNGEKTEVSSDQYETREGNTIAAGDNKLLLFYGVSNKNDNKRFSFNAAVPGAKKGVFPITEIDQTPGFSITTSMFPNAGALKAKSGTIEITVMPGGDGYVEGKFSGVCESTNSGLAPGTFNIGGTFRLKKRLE